MANVAIRPPQPHRREICIMKLDVLMKAIETNQ
jgi:hypothetical protein